MRIHPLLCTLNMFRLLSVLLIVVSAANIAAPIASAVEEPAPDRGATRARIDELTKAFTVLKHPATLGLLREAIALSISFGAPAYNAGDHAACGDFYAETAVNLVKAFPADAMATQDAARGLRELRASTERAAHITDADRRAWTMRFGFDQVTMACDAMGQHGTMLARSGMEYFHRADYEEAELAFASALEIQTELSGGGIDSIPWEVRFAGVMRGQTRLALGHIADAAAMVGAGIAVTPELAKADFDLHGLYGERVELDHALADLAVYVDQHPQEVDARFLLGFEQRFTGRKDEAEKTFARVLILVPGHAGARLLGRPKGAADAGGDAGAGDAGEGGADSAVP